MATKVKPIRLNITWTPQVGNVPTYVSADTFAWWAGWWGGASFWRFLSLWDCTTGQPISFPEATPYAYTTWDYFMVSVVSTATPPVNYRPNWSSYTGTASSTVETDEVLAWDVYVYDGSVWLLQSNNEKTVAFANIAGQPTDNTNLANDLLAKQDVLTPSTWISISSNVISNTWVTSFNGSTWTVTYTAPVTSVNSNTWAVTVSEFSPSNAGSTWDVLKKTAWWYERWTAGTSYTDFAWQTKSGATIELSLNTYINTPTANFTVNAPSTILDGMVYILRIDNWATAYTMTLWTDIDNSLNVDTTLSASWTDQFVFLAFNGQLELQPEVTL